MYVSLAVIQSEVNLLEILELTQTRFKLMSDW